MSSGARHDRPRATRAIAIGAPAAAALTLSMLVLSSQQELDAELQLEAENEAVAGARLPLRARLYAGLSRIEGPALVAAPCRVELSDADGMLRASTWLHAGLGPSLEGAIVVPAALHGRATLRAVAAFEEQRPTLERELRIDAAPRTGATPSPRALAPLQRFALGPLRVEGDAPPPNALRARVRGGVCVPEAPCELLVHVGEPAASLQLRATPSVTPDEASARPGRLTAGVLALRLVVHGPEAVTELVVTRAGQRVANLALRLPVALGTSRAVAPEGLARAGEHLRIALASTDHDCIADLFHDGRLHDTTTLRDCNEGANLPRALSPGAMRIQLRRDPFGSEHAAVVNVYARAADQSPEDALIDLAASALRVDPSDALARTLLHQPSAPKNPLSGVQDDAPPVASPTTEARSALQREHDLTASYLLAMLDEGLLAMPSAVSSLPRAQLELAARRAQHRKLGVLVLALCAVALAALLAERGIASSAEAQVVLAAAGSDAAARRRQRARSLLSLVSTVASLLLVFALIAVYVVVRGRGPLGP